MNPELTINDASAWAQGIKQTLESLLAVGRHGGGLSRFPKTHGNPSGAELLSTKSRIIIGMDREMRFGSSNNGRTRRKPPSRFESPANCKCGTDASKLPERAGRSRPKMVRWTPSSPQSPNAQEPIRWPRDTCGLRGRPDAGQLAVPPQRLLHGVETRSRPGRLRRRDCRR